MSRKENVRIQGISTSSQGGFGSNVSNPPDGGVMGMLRLRNEKAMQVELWRACLASQLFALGEELSRVDRILNGYARSETS